MLPLPINHHSKFDQDKSMSNNKQVIHLEECEECYALIEYRGQPHNCPLNQDDEDEKFVDHLELLLEEIHKGSH